MCFFFKVKISIFRQNHLTFTDQRYLSQDRPEELLIYFVVLANIHCSACPQSEHSGGERLKFGSERFFLDGCPDAPLDFNLDGRSAEVAPRTLCIVKDTCLPLSVAAIVQSDLPTLTPPAQSIRFNCFILNSDVDVWLELLLSHLLPFHFPLNSSRQSSFITTERAVQNLPTVPCW